MVHSLHLLLKYGALEGWPLTVFCTISRLHLPEAGKTRILRPPEQGSCRRHGMRLQHRDLQVRGLSFRRRNRCLG